MLQKQHRKIFSAPSTALPLAREAHQGSCIPMGSSEHRELKQCKPKAAPWHGADSPAQGAWDAAQGDGSLLRLLSVTEAVQESSW